MKEIKTILTRETVIVGLLLLAFVLLVDMKTKGQEENGNDRVATERWEYLALAGPSSSNLAPTNNPRMRKEPAAAFGREAFVLEQHLDKLGANGWELVAVAGPPTDPAYYFRRRK